MSNTQTYRVETVYTARNQSSAAMGEIAKSAREAAEHIRGLKESLKHLGEGFMIFEMFHKGKEALIGYNSELEQSKVQIAGMLTLYTGSPIEKSFDRAALSVERFQVMARESSLTTSELVRAAGAISQPLTQAGVKMTDIERLAFGMANASKAFGISVESSSMDVQQSLNQGMHVGDRFAHAIMGQKGMGKSGNGMSQQEFNALDQAHRVKAWEAGLESAGVTALAKKHGEDTLDGVMSTLKDNFQITLGHVGLPLFKAITNEVKSWNAWIDQNRGKLEEIGKVVGEKLVEGFQAIKSVFSFIYDHAGTLLKIGEVYAAIKVSSMLGGGMASSALGMIGSAAGGGSGLLGFLRRGTGFSDSVDPLTGLYSSSNDRGGRGRQDVGGFRGAAENAGMLGAALGLGAAFGTLIDQTYHFSESLSSSWKINGETLDVADRTTHQFALLSNSMNVFDDAIRRAKDLDPNGGARNTEASANLRGGGNFYGQQANFLHDLIRDLEQGSAMTRAKALTSMESRAKEFGFDQSDMANAMNNPEAFIKHAQGMSAAYTSRDAQARSGADSAFATIPAEMQKALKEGQMKDKVMQNLMRAELALMGDMVAGKFSAAKTLTKEMIDQAIKDADPDITPHAKVNQTINVHIEQVSAKDPNRWIAEMEDLANSARRRPTRAKNPSGYSNSTR